MSSEPDERQPDDALLPGRLRPLCSAECRYGHARLALLRPRHALVPSERRVLLHADAPRTSGRRRRPHTLAPDQSMSRGRATQGALGSHDPGPRPQCRRPYRNSDRPVRGAPRLPPDRDDQLQRAEPVPTDLRRQADVWPVRVLSVPLVPHVPGFLRVPCPDVGTPCWSQQNQQNLWNQKGTGRTGRGAVPRRPSCNGAMVWPAG
jgi:hypothetical protein